MKTLLALIVIVALGAGAYWYLTNSDHKDVVEQAQSQAAKTAQKVEDTVKDKFKDFSLSAPEIKDELARSGRVVRKKAQEVGSVIADATADTRITGMIKAKLVQDPNLSALKISVNTTDGVVTLSGSVASAEEIAQAMKLALETDGVREAVSTLQVRAIK